MQISWRFNIRNIQIFEDLILVSNKRDTAMLLPICCYCFGFLSCCRKQLSWANIFPHSLSDSGFAFSGVCLWLCLSVNSWTEIFRASCYGRKDGQVRRLLYRSARVVITDQTSLWSIDFFLFWLWSGLRLVEAESSSTLILSPRSDLELHCICEVQSQPVWYYNGEPLPEDPQTSIAVTMASGSNEKHSFLARQSSDSESTLDGQYQCRDATGYQTDSDVLLVMYAA